ncbi:hypothetical protein GCM10007425_29390 [Lysinibacillus alkalisoli]|uniref:RNA polymerase sigma factor 70 region 4 type 2 domain-containing protein n=2 Tax=Lysinibacillus alkalisoli TaxID=1911548 RepID=A0A917GA34_9BACI|nr:hypothetical protein GCM10007425_29390 [Lysinibacillus alkalisoli]
MLDMLSSYHETKKRTKELKHQLEEKRETMKDNRSETASLDNEISIVNSMLSDIEYTIAWLTSGRQPGAMRGIERQAAYKREVPFDSKWLDVMIEQGTIIHELEKPDGEVEEMKEQLVADLKKCLTSTQQDVFIMVAQGLERSNIAKVLGISRQAVHETIVRGKRNIKEAGWMMV